MSEDVSGGEAKKEGHDGTQERLRGDFRNCLWFIWKCLQLPDPTPIQYAIAEFLADARNDRIIIEAFRGVGKSWITAAYCIYVWLINPHVRILVVSGSKPRADKFAQFVRRLLYEIPEFHYLRPRKGQRDAVNAFDVGPAANAQAPSMTSLGVTGQLTGNRADLIVADDVETQQNSLTQGARDTLRDAVKEFENIVTPGGRNIFLGTPHYEASLYNEKRQQGYKRRLFPAEYPSARQIAGYGGDLAPLITRRMEQVENLAGLPTDPRRFDEQDLAKRRAALGRSTYLLQFMLDTSLSDAERYPLKISDLILFPFGITKAPASLDWTQTPAFVAQDVPSVGFSGDVWRRPLYVDSDRMPFTGSVMAIDPAGTGADETAYAVVKLLNGRLFLAAAGGLPGGYSAPCLDALCQVAKYQEVNTLVIESNFGDGMFSRLLQPVLARVHPCRMEEVRSTTQKERRIIDTLEPVMNQHRLVVHEDVALADYQKNRETPQRQLFWQMTRLTRDRGCLGHDDRIDALALAVAFWAEAMGRDTAQAAEDARGDMLDEYMRQEEEKMARMGVPYTPPANSWFTLS